MSRRRLTPLVLAAATAAALSAPTGAHAATTSSTCSKASTARGVTRIAKSKLGVVFTRDRKPVFIPGATLLGCAYGGKVVKLSRICCEGERVKVGGTFVFYAYQGSAEGDETDKVGLYDLKTGKRLKFKKLRPNAEGPDPEIETGGNAYSLTVTSKGSVAWIQEITDDNGEPTGSLELRIADGPKRSERIADTGKLSKDSVKLSADEKTLTYTKDGATKTVQLTAP
jgi:hypothetical protein